MSGRSPITADELPGSDSWQASAGGIPCRRVRIGQGRHLSARVRTSGVYARHGQERRAGVR